MISDMLHSINYCDNSPARGSSTLKIVCYSDLQDSKAPLFEVRLELEGGDTVFYPSLGFGISDCFYDMVEKLISDVYKAAEWVPRISKTNKISYQVSTVPVNLGKTGITFFLTAKE